jgi:hypothetical protein
MPPSTPTLTPEETILDALRDGPLPRVDLILVDRRFDDDRCRALGLLLRAGTVREIERAVLCERCNGEGWYDHGAGRLRCFGCRGGVRFRHLIELAHA